MSISSNIVMNKVIAISGPPGSGKTSLMLELSKRISCVCLDYDQYQQITERPVYELSNWMQDSANYNDFVVPALAQDLYKLKSGESVKEPNTDRLIKSQECIVFETPLGREHKASGQHIDKLVWLEVSLDIALARNIKAFSKIFLSHESMSRIKDDLNWLDMYLNNYLKHIRPMLELQRNKLMTDADIIIDAELELELMATSLMGELSLS